MLVIAVPAEGAMALARIPYFLPSMARVRVKPMIPAFAVEYWEKVETISISAVIANCLHWPGRSCRLEEEVYPGSACFLKNEGEHKHTDTDLRCSRDDTTILLLLEGRPEGFGALQAWCEQRISGRLGV